MPISAFFSQEQTGPQLFPLFEVVCSPRLQHSTQFCRASQSDLEVGQGWHVLFATTAVFDGGSCNFSVWFQWSSCLLKYYSYGALARADILPVRCTAKIETNLELTNNPF